MTTDVMLTADKLSAGYGENNEILHQVSFQVNRGEMVGLIGCNGAGKSTLLKTLRGMLPPLGGKALINGKDITAFSNRDFACQAAYLQQGVEVAFGYTTREIVMAGRYPRLRWWEKEGPEDEEIVDACMAYTGVAELKEKVMQSISGGQRQRVLLAKVLAQQTPLLFLDEPATGLDIFYQEEIFRFCRELCNAGKTVLMVVHELSLAARFCSRLMLIGKHTLLADGLPEQVLTEENLTEAYDVPVRVVTNPLTGNAEVFTEAATDEKHRSLLTRILSGSSRGGEHPV